MSEQAANEAGNGAGSVTVGLPDERPWERRAAWAVSVIANMRPEVEPDRTVGGAYQPHVYFAYSAGRIKIGTTMYTSKRGRNLAGHSPLPVTIILTIPGGADLEKRLHDCLAGERLHGEWFRMSPDMRKLLDGALCRTGQRKFKKAEAEFRKWALAELGHSQNPK